MHKDRVNTSISKSILIAINGDVISNNDNHVRRYEALSTSTSLDFRRLVQVLEKTNGKINDTISLSKSGLLKLPKKDHIVEPTSIYIEAQFEQLHQDESLNVEWHSELEPQNLTSNQNTVEEYRMEKGNDQSTKILLLACL